MLERLERPALKVLIVCAGEEGGYANRHQSHMVGNCGKCYERKEHGDMGEKDGAEGLICPVGSGPDM